MVCPITQGDHNNGLHYHQRRTEPWLQIHTENLVKFGHVVCMIEQTKDQNTDTLFSVLCTPPWHNVITDDSLLIAMMQYFVSTRCQYYEL